MGGTVSMGEAIQTGLTTVIDIFTTNVIPLLSQEPFNYFLGLALFGCGCAVFAKVRGIV